MNDYTLSDGDAGDQPPGIVASLPMVLRQRKWLLIVPAITIMLAALAAAFLLPRTYQAKAVLLVEAKDSPDVSGQGQISAQDNPIDRRMARIRQRILSSPDLIELIQAHDLYGASRHAEPMSSLVERMRNATDIGAISADIQSTPFGGGSGSIAFSLSFKYPTPVAAQIVTQAFVDRLLKLDATQSRADAQQNVNFLQDQETGLQQQVAQIEGRIKQIAGANGAALSSANSSMVPSIGGVDYAGQITSLRRENAQLSAQASTAVERDPGVIAAEAALSAAQATYSDTHPDVQLARRRLELVRANANGASNRAISASVGRQIAANNAAIAELSRQRGQDASRQAMLSAAQARGPAVFQEVQQLQARVDMIRTNLSRVSTSLLNARSVSKLTNDQRNERLTLIEPPVVPDRPASPNVLLLIVGGIVAGIGAGAALVLAVELIQRPIRSAAQVAHLLGEPPLAVVPILSARQGGFGRLFGRRSGARRQHVADSA